MIRPPNLFDKFLILLTGIIWGSAFMAMKIAVETTPALWVATMRVAIGCLALLLWMRVTRVSFPKDKKTWVQMLWVGILGNLMPFFLISWGEKSISSSTASILMATGPFISLALAHFTTKDDRFSWNKLGVMTLGFMGVLVIIGWDALKGLTESVVGQLAVILASFGYVLAGMVTRNIKSSNATAITAGGLLWGSILGLPLSWFLAPSGLANTDLTSWLALLWLGIAPTAFAFVCRTWLIQSLGYTAFSYVTYIVPLSGVFLGVAVLDEPFKMSMLVALFLIIFGLFISGKKKS